MQVFHVQEHWPGLFASILRMLLVYHNSGLDFHDDVLVSYLKNKCPPLFERSTWKHSLDFHENLSLNGRTDSRIRFSYMPE